MKTITDLFDTFHSARRFTLRVAQHYQGTKMRVVCKDAGLIRMYEGVIKANSELTTFVGTEELVNECIVSIELLEF